MARPLRQKEFATIPIDDRHSPQVRKRLSAPAVRTFFNVADTWGLTVKEQLALLGFPAPSTYHKYKAGQVGTLSYDTLTRVSLVLGIYKALHILYPSDALADSWIRLPNANDLFGGRPAIHLMMNGGIDGLFQVRRLLDGRRG
jgi:hypothetical protein